MISNSVNIHIDDLLRGRDKTIAHNGLVETLYKFKVIDEMWKHMMIECFWPYDEPPFVYMGSGDEDGKTQ